MFSLHDLEAIIAERAKAAPEHSYTAKLVAAGMARASKKLGEEAVETVIAAMGKGMGGAGSEKGRSELVNESADLLYHLLVVLHMAQIPVQDVLDELASRTRQSGLEEKASRTEN
jgi:phosphoribosyl-ATP pyrophosphohydrolase